MTAPAIAHRSAPTLPQAAKAPQPPVAAAAPQAAWEGESLALGQNPAAAEGADLAKRQAVAGLVRRSINGLSRQALATRVGQRSLLGTVVRQGLRSPAAKHGMKGLGQQKKLRQSPWAEPAAPLVGPPKAPSTWLQGLQQTALWRSVASLPERFPALGVALKLLAPLGAWLNFRSSLRISRETLAQEGHSAFTRRGLVASTALAGVSAVAASVVAGASLGILPATPGLLAWGSYVASAGGLASGAALVAVDALQSLRRADAGPGEKALAVLATASSVGLSVLALAGLGGVAGFVLGAGAIGFSLAKAWAPEAPWAAALGRAVGFKAPKAAPANKPA